MTTDLSVGLSRQPWRICGVYPYRLGLRYWVLRVTACYDAGAGEMVSRDPMLMAQRMSLFGDAPVAVENPYRAIHSRWTLRHCPSPVNGDCEEFV